MKLIINNIFKSLIIFYFITSAFGYSTERKVGDIMQIALPITAISSTYYMNDTNGAKQFLKSYFTTSVFTYLLKVATHKLRPDGSDYMSFPSGHTSSAFSGASFIHFRYGFKYSIPLYFLASFTGYSRVYADKHHTEDVIAGAGLAIFNSWYFTSKYNKSYSFNLYYNPNSKTIGINIYKLDF